MYPKAVHEWFTTIANANPDHIAIETVLRKVTFAELHGFSSATAKTLLSAGSRFGDVVAIFSEDRLSIISALIGSLKAGRPFVNIGADLPENRIRTLVEVARPRFVLFDGTHAEKVARCFPQVQPVPIASRYDVRTANDPVLGDWNGDDFCYIFFTSGSTGRPKGIAGRFKGIDHFIRWELDHFTSGSPVRVSQLISPGFDAFLRDVFVPLCSGGTLCIPDEQVRRDPAALVEWLATARINLVHTVPSVFRALLENVQGPEQLKDLNTVLVSGEPLFPSDVRKWSTRLGERVKLINLYGPTETTMTKFFYVVTPEDQRKASVPIGKPMDGARAMLMDERGRPCPDGTIGEIYIRTPYRSLGYYNEPELTSQVFIPNPFTSEPSDLIYKTGDFARALPSGDFEFKGRRDHQVKIRGVRVELAEIESYVRESDLVSDCVAIDRDDDFQAKYICCYLVLKPGATVEEVHHWLSSNLPEYMVPSLLVPVVALPRLSNGKIDRKLLPSPQLESTADAVPGTETEKILAELWMEILHLPSVGVHDSFFRIGGHSLRAAQIAARIRNIFNIDYPLRALFDDPTIARTATRIEKLREGPETVHVPPLQPVPRSGPIPLSFAQRRLWFIDQLEGRSAAYNIPVAVKITGDLPVEALIWSLNEIVRRHEVLRTSLPARNGEPVQAISDTLDLDIQFTDLTGLPAEELSRAVEEIRQEEAGFCFNLNSGPLFRAHLLKTGAQEYVLLVTMHHIVSDAWSAGVLIREFNVLFAARSKGETPQLPPLRFQYADFAAWQRNWLQGEVLEQHVTFWKQRLEGIEVLDLPVDRPRNNLPTHAGSSLPFTCSAELSARLSQMAQSEHTTLFTILIAAFQMLMGRYAGNDDVCIGTDIANRNQPELELMIGFFVNQIVVRTRLQGNPEFRQLAGAVRDYLLEAYSYQDLPFEQLVEEIAPQRDLSRSPLFQVKLVLQNQPVEAPQFGSLAVEEIPREYRFARFDFTLVVQETPSGLNGILEYSTDLFDRGTVEAMLNRFKRVLEAVTENPSAHIRQVALITASEERHLLSEWTGPGLLGGERCIHELFEDQVRNTPGNIALAFGQQSLSYNELDQRANRLGHYLRSLGAGPDMVIGVCCNPCEELIIAVLGILKAGAAYLPLDPEYPLARLEYMLSDSSAPVVLTLSSMQNKLPSGYFHMICLDTEKEPLDSQPSTRVAANVQPANLAYVIYTSGSTGNPKGVMVTHRGAVNLAFAQKKVFGVRSGSPVLQFASISFDASCWEWIMALTAGGKLLLADRSDLIPGKEMVDLLEREKVEFLTIPPSVLAAFPTCELPSLHTIVVAGEACLLGLVERWSAGRRFFDAYGPTETTVCATISEPLQKSADLSIGRPLLNTRICLLDQEHLLAPGGLAGELCVSGTGVARGYLNRPDLTAERFLPDPFSATPGERMYCTGDRARWRTDGKLEFLGRKDEQVKVRGFRIELGEIEAALSSLSGVRQCAVIVTGEEDDAGSQRIVAYWVPDKNLPQDEAGLRSGLSRRLPDYMFPATFVALDELPLTSNGKIDRKSLPRPNRVIKTQHIPRTSIEEILLDIWNQLGVRCSGTEDNFFECGGHSLLATQVVSRVRDVFKIELPLRTLFEAPILREYALHIEDAVRRGVRPKVPTIQPATRDQALPLSFAQSRLWFLEQLEPDTALYNIPTAVRCRGSVDFFAIQKTLTEIVHRHEVLRTFFPIENGEPTQCISPVSELALSLIDLSALTKAAAEELGHRLARQETSTPFDLASGPLLRVRLILFESDDFVALLTMHHIVSDHWSAGILVHEFTTLYEAFKQGKPSPLPPLSIQYADFAVWQKAWLQGEILDGEVEYWRRQLEGLRMLEMPADERSRGENIRAGGQVHFEVGGELSAKLKRLAEERGVTLFMVLLSCYQVLLWRYTGQRDVAVGTDVANRTLGETEGLIGFFVNQLVLRSDVGGNPRYEEFLRRVREMALEAYAHQDLPFERLVEELQPERDLGRSPLFQVKIVWLNALASKLEMSDTSLSGFAIGHSRTRYDLLLALGVEGGRIAGTVEYAAELFSAAMMERLMQHFQMLLAEVAAAPQKRLEELQLLTMEERDELLRSGQGEELRLEAQDLLVQRFAQQRQRTPDALAVISQDSSLTYKELDESSDALAYSLWCLGVRAETRVALVFGRKPEVVLGILATLKVGGCYVPLDPEEAPERLAHMLQDSQIALVLTLECFRDLVQSPWLQVLCLDAEGEPWRMSQVAVEFPLLDPLSLACVIYTSGSSGQPKGVAVTHCGLAARCDDLARKYCLCPGDLFLQAVSPSFDAFGAEIFTTLIRGATLLMCGNPLQLDEQSFLELIARKKPHVLHVPSAYSQRLMEYADGNSGRLPASVRLTIIGGEAMPESRAQRWAKLTGAPVLNEYGPTEATITATVQEITGDQEWRERSLPIGRPIGGTGVYVVDNQGSLAPQGLAGELWIGGVGVARGYLGQAARTAERFIPDGISGRPAQRLYRTGDLVRWGADKELLFLGRKDEQLKVRGYRIEPGEIEAVLARHPGIRSSIVLARENGAAGPQLVAYVVAQPVDMPISEKEIKSYLRGRLPDYMVPSRIVLMLELPLTLNGKVDRNALPAPSVQDKDLVPEDTDKISAGSVVAQIVARMWAHMLDKSSVALNDNFFEIGGHSLLATQVITRIRKIFKVDLLVRALFENPTPNELAAEIERTRSNSVFAQAPAIIPADRSQDLPLSFAQQRLWFIDRLIGGGSAYNVPFVVRLSGAIDETALQKAVNEIVRRHEVLRTAFPDYNGTPVQSIAPPAPVPIKVVDLTDEPDRETVAQHLTNEEARQPFRLQHGPLVRVMVLRLDESDRFLMVTLHHIVADGWSKGIMVREFVALYDAFVAGNPSPLPELPIQYVDFAVWQREWLTGPLLEEHLSYWRRQLQDVQVLELPADYARPAFATQRGALMHFELSAELSLKVANLCNREGVTLFMALLAAFQIVLGRYAAQDDVTVGTVIANRNRAEIENLVGFFVNSLALRTRLTPKDSFLMLLAQVRDVALSAYEHQDLPFELIVEDLNPDRDLARTPLYQALFAVQNTPRKNFDLADARVSVANTEHHQSLVDLALVLWDNPHKLGGGLEYSTDLYQAASMSRLLDRYTLVLEMMTNDPEMRLEDVVLLTPAERQELAAWNATSQEWNGPDSIVRIFTHQVQLTPDAPALACGLVCLTYADLNRRSNQLAHYLRELGAGPEVRVGLCVRRSIEMIVGLLGILKAGAAYVPLDASYPPERLRYMLEDSLTPIVVTEQCLQDNLPIQWQQVVCLDSDWNLIGTYPEAGPGCEVLPGHLAYVIYTSGSTGQPKGVMLTHKGAYNLARAQQDLFAVRPGDAVLQFASLSFDAATWEWMMALLAGGKLVLVPADTPLVGNILADVVKRESVAFLTAPPSVLAAMPEGEELPSLRTIVVAGEACPEELIHRWAHGRRFFDAYGPTETTVCATASNPLQPHDRINIGRAIPNLQVHVLDAAGKLACPGVIGELYVSGEGLARGYLNRPGLTAGRFVPNPFSEQPGGRMYRSGDRVRWRNEGQLEFISRIDDQVKVRGYRIELGEIELVVKSHSEVRDAMAAVRQGPDGSQNLVVCVVPRKPRPTMLINGHVLPNGMVVAQKNKYETETLYDEIFVREVYCRHGIRLPADGCVFDVGANIGVFTLYASHKCARGRVFAFEPIGPIYKDLEANLQWCGAETKVFQCALSDRAGKAQFTYFPRNAAMSARSDYVSPAEETEVIRRSLVNQSRNGGQAEELLRYMDELMAGRFEGEVISCEMRRLSDVMRQEKVDHIDLLKIDVERSELDVLLGIDEQDWEKIDQVVLEVHNRVANRSENRAEEIRCLLAQHGFDVVVAEDEMLKDSNIYMVYALRQHVRSSQEEIILSWPLAQSTLDVAILRSYLQTKLPPYMVPGEIILLRDLPRLPNGKLDRNNVPLAGAELSTLRPVTAPRDGNETALVQIWSEVLMREDIGIRDDFFQIGGSSLNAVSVCARVSALFKAHVPVRTIFDHPTIETMAAYLRQGISATVPSTVVPIRATGSRTPLFCVHPGSGLPHCYLTLARNLGADQPVYAIQSLGFREGEEPFRDIKHMAARYVSDVRAVYPDGPYQIVGWSMGVAPAYEMACQLSEAGATVSLLGFLDAGFTAASAEIPTEQWDQAMLKAEMNIVLAQAALYVPNAREELAKMELEQAVAGYLERAKLIDQIPADVTLEQFRRVIRVMASNMLAQMSYQPRIYNGAVTLFRTPLVEGMDASYGLEKLVSGGLHCFEIADTHHLEFVNEPELAQLLLRAIDSASQTMTASAL